MRVNATKKEICFIQSHEQRQEYLVQNSVLCQYTTRVFHNCCCCYNHFLSTVQSPEQLAYFDTDRDYIEVRINIFLIPFLLSLLLLLLLLPWCYVIKAIDTTTSSIITTSIIDPFALSLLPFLPQALSLLSFLLQVLLLLLHHHPYYCIHCCYDNSYYYYSNTTAALLLQSLNWLCYLRIATIDTTTISTITKIDPP